MDDLLKRHRQELKDLQSRITQKKKQATKKTRRGVNDECADLERNLREQQASELACLDNGQEPQIVSSELSDRIGLEEENGTNEDTHDIGQLVASVSVSSKPSADGSIKKPSRQKARLARRAANHEAVMEQAEKEAADLPDLRATERESMRDAYTSKGLVEFDIRSDGHCLYAAVADQLLDAGIDPKTWIEAKSPNLVSSNMAGYQVTRQVAAAFISHNSDDFEPFLDEPLPNYIKTIRETGEWGGHLEILALARAYGVNIKVLQGNGQVENIDALVGDDAPVLWLAYYRHSYGLGEHYNSLRRAS